VYLGVPTIVCFSTKFRVGRIPEVPSLIHKYSSFYDTEAINLILTTDLIIPMPWPKGRDILRWSMAVKVVGWFSVVL